MDRLRSYPTVAVIALGAALACVAQAPSFQPDTTFQGSTLTGWNTFGSAHWSARDGVITGDASGGGGGLLMFNKPLQDAGLYTSFHCEGECNTGVLVRLQKTDAGMTGFLVSAKGTEMAAYKVTFDADGKETGRTRLRNAAGTIRFAPPAPPTPAAGAPAGPPRGFPGGARPASNIVSPIPRVTPGLRPDGWNDVEVIMDADILRGFFNDGGGQASGATESMDGFGPVALYVGAGSKVEFRNLSVKDLAMKYMPKEEVSKNYRMQRVNEYYYGWSAAAADFNKDGKMDIVSGPYIYYGPDYTTSREIYPAQVINASTEYSQTAWVEHAYDYTGDGWPDILTTSHADGGRAGAILYVNPKGESRRWEKFSVVAPIDSEATLSCDVDGDGKPDLVYMGGRFMSWAKPDPANPTGKWTVHHVSEEGPWPAHGIGCGDVNGDGRKDILGAYGWWEQPASGPGDGPWKYHPVAFGDAGRTASGGAEIAVYDINGDGLPDVVTAMQAHGWGIAWFEQKKSASGEISFVKHVVMGHTPEESAGGVVFTEPHATAVADMDGDGIPDYIVTKRYWSHLDDFNDPDPYGAPVIYIYRTVRDKSAPGGARFVPELVHNLSGGGSDILPVDLNGDGAMDIVTSTRSGTYIFWGTQHVKKAQK